MNRNTLLAFFVWAIDVDALSLPVTTCWEKFQKAAWGIYRNYTDPSDELLYCPNLVGKNPINVMVDYTLCYAKMWVISGTRNYGKYDELIKSYKR
jgi:hypothetical protein